MINITKKHVTQHMWNSILHGVSHTKNIVFRYFRCDSMRSTCAFTCDAFKGTCVVFWGFTCDPFRGRCGFSTCFIFCISYIVFYHVIFLSYTCWYQMWNFGWGEIFYFTCEKLNFICAFFVREAMSWHHSKTNMHIVFKQVWVWVLILCCGLKITSRTVIAQIIYFKLVLTSYILLAYTDC